MTNCQTDLQIVILAAGNGSRMSSNLPKVMHKIGDHPMINMVVSNALAVTKDVILVHSKKLLEYLTSYKKLCKFALQTTINGTASAVEAAFHLLDHEKTIIVLYGDNPLITADIISNLKDQLNKNRSSLITLAFHRENPAQYGRIIVDKNGKFIKIVEHKLANDAEKQVQLCNSGIMAFAPYIIKKYLPQCLIQTHKVQELYLTKMVEICALNNEPVSYFISNNADSVIGINTQEELQEANRLWGLR
jgi:UDP-N-acetylglucosamine pyrophosphorylase